MIPRSEHDRGGVDDARASIRGRACRRARARQPRRGLLVGARSRASLGVLAIALLGIALVAVQQSPGPTPVAHFALVRALSNGTAEIGPGVTIDSAYIDGRYFANKAPGLAFALLPPYLGLRAVGVQPAAPGDGDAFRSSLWQLTLLGAVLPAVVLMLLMFVAVERCIPGTAG